MLLFLLSLGGIPFVAGFWAKLYVFWAAAQRNARGGGGLDNRAFARYPDSVTFSVTGGGSWPS